MKIPSLWHSFTSPHARMPALLGFAFHSHFPWKISSFHDALFSFLFGHCNSSSVSRFKALDKVFAWTGVRMVKENFDLRECSFVVELLESFIQKIKTISESLTRSWVRYKKSQEMAKKGYN